MRRCTAWLEISGPVNHLLSRAGFGQVGSHHLGILHWTLSESVRIPGISTAFLPFVPAKADLLQSRANWKIPVRPVARTVPRRRVQRSCLSSFHSKGSSRRVVPVLGPNLAVSQAWRGRCRWKGLKKDTTAGSCQVPSSSESRVPKTSKHMTC